MPKSGFPCAGAWLAILLCARAEAGGIVEGVVTLPTAKAAPPSAASRYPGTATPANYTNTAPNPAVAGVYLEGTAKAAPDPNKVYEMGQRHFQFVPSFLIVPKGARVNFPNYDNDYHNVFSYSKAKEFDLGRYRKEEKPPIMIFDKAGVVEINCEIHEHMHGTILVVDTPWFASTDADGSGKFHLENVPPGNYTLKAWISQKQLLSQPVEVKEGQTTTVALTGK